MVALFKSSDERQIDEAIRHSSLHTEAELAAVFLTRSVPYQSYLICDGLILGSLMSVGLWVFHILGNYLFLLAVQFITIFLVVYLPPLRQLFLRFVPSSVKKQAAARNAAFRFLHLVHHLPASKPAVLLYVSRAERYIHILPSRTMHEKIPKEVWDDVVKDFSKSISKLGPKEASLLAIKEMTEILALYYPHKKNS